MSVPFETATPALAELKTPDGTFLIQERRSKPRDPSRKPAETRNGYSSSSQMSVIGGLIIIGVLVASYTQKYDAAIGHVNGALPVPQVGYLALQLYLARAAYRLFHDVQQIKSIGAFIEYRLTRYLPAVIPAVLLGFVISQFAGLSCFTAKLSSLPANLTMMADLLGVPDIDSSHWRLKIELLQSVLIGMAWFGPMRRHLAWFLLAGLAVNIFYIGGEPARQNVATWHGLLSCDGYLPLSAFGIALHRLVADRSSRSWWIVAATALMFVFLSNTPLHGFIVVLSLVVLSAIVLGHLKWLGRLTWLASLGSIAFPIYVVHYVMGFVVIQRMESVGFHPVVAVLAASILAIGLGKTFSLLFERPAMAYVPVAIQVIRRIAGPKGAFVQGASKSSTVGTGALS